MPRAIDPASINVGTGLAAEDSIEANALVHPTGGNDGLRVHILDPSRAHMAAAVGVVDAAAHFVSDEVEGALAELAGAGAATHTNGFIVGGTFTSVGLVLTIATPTSVMLAGTEHSYAGISVTLADNQTQYVYIDAGTGVLTAALAAPTQASEDILVAEVTTAGGVVTGSRDGRFFVLNGERKPDYTVRSQGVDANRHSEANFESLIAAFLWLELYSTTTSRKTTLIVRGSETIAATLQVPIPNLIIQGDGTAQFLTGAVLTPMFDLNGQDKTCFRDLLFICDHGGSIAIDDTGGSAQDVLIENCAIQTGGADWDRAISLAQTVTNSTRLRITGCNIDAVNYGVYIAQPDLAWVVDCNVTCASGSAGIGISMGALGVASNLTEGKSLVRGCHVSGFSLGILLKGADLIASECTLEYAPTGIQIGESGISSPSCRVLNTSITLSSSTGMVGIDVDQALNAKIASCQIFNNRAPASYGGADVPYGVVVRAGSDNVTIIDTHIEGFYNSTGDLGTGINFQDGALTSSVQSCFVSTVVTGIASAASCATLRIEGTHIEDARYGMSLSGSEPVVVGCTINLGLGAGRGLVGMLLDTNASKARIADCRINNGRNPALYGAGEEPRGITVSSINDVSIDNCHIEGFFRTGASLGYCVEVAGTSDNTKIQGCTLSEGQAGVLMGSSATTTSVLDTTITEAVTGLALSGAQPVVSGCNIVLGAVSPLLGLVGILVDTNGNEAQISDTTIRNARAAGSYFLSETPIGISLDSVDDVSIDHCRVEGFYRSSGTPSGYGAEVVGSSNTKIQGCVFKTSLTGIRAANASASISIMGTSIEAVETGLSLAGSQPLVADCVITLDATIGLTGIHLENNASQGRIVDSYIENPRAAASYAVLVPRGVYVDAVDDVSIDNCHIKDFLNSVTPTGFGVDSTGANTQVHGCTVDTAEIGVRGTGLSSMFSIVDATIRGVGTGIRFAGTDSLVTNCFISTDAVRGVEGIIVAGPRAKISSCFINNDRDQTVTPYGVGDTPIGIWVNSVDDVAINDCNINRFFNQVGASGMGISIGQDSDHTSITGGQIDTTQVGVFVQPAGGGSNPTHTTIQGLTIIAVETGMFLFGEDNIVDTCTVLLNDATASSPAGTQAFVFGDGLTANTGNRTLLTDCKAIMDRSWTTEVTVPLGIHITSSHAKVDNCFIQGFWNQGASPGGEGVLLTPGTDQATVRDSTFAGCYNGVSVVGSQDSWTIEGCRFTNLAGVGIVSGSGDQILVADNQFKFNSGTSSTALSFGVGCTDLTISGNYIDGNLGVTDGILVQGSTSESRRVNVANNTIQQITASGIHFIGYVQEFILDGNIIDGYRSDAPYVPTARGIYLESTVNGEVQDGAITGNTVLRCTEGIIGVGTDANPIQYLSITGNTVHHCGYVEVVADSFEGAGTKGIGIDHGRDITIAANVVRDIGHGINDSDVEGFPGANVKSNGVYCRNSKHLIVQSNNIRNIVSDGTGFGTGIHFQTQSSGSVYANFVVDAINVSDNNLFWSSGLSGNGEGAFGILLVGHLGTEATTTKHLWRDVVVTGNTVRRTSMAAIEILVREATVINEVVVSNNAVTASGEGLAFIVGVSATATTEFRNLQVRGNVVRDMTKRGILLTISNGGTFANAVVAGNTIMQIAGDGTSTVPGNGVHVEASGPTAMVAVQVDGNQIENVGTGGTGSGIAFGATTTDVILFSRFTANHNQILTAADDGILFASNTVDIANLDFSDNEISGVGRGMALVVGGVTNTDIDQLIIRGNIIRSSATQGGIVITMNGIARNFIVANNRVLCPGTTGNVLSIGVLNTLDVGSDVYHENLSITDNIFEGGDTGVNLQFGTSAALAGKVRNLTLADNIVRDPNNRGLYFSVAKATNGPAPSVANVSVLGNTFERTAAQGVEFVLGTTLVAILDVVNLRVSNNNFESCKHTGSGNAAFVMTTRARMLNTRIESNTFHNCGTTDQISTGTLWIKLGQGNAVIEPSENFDIIENEFHSCGGVGILFESYTALLTQRRIRNLRIAGNSIREQLNDAIRVDASAFDAFSNVDITENQIDTINTGSLSERGIYVLGPSGATTYGITASRNSLGVLGDEAILFSFPQSIENCSVDGNVIQAPTTTGNALYLDFAQAVQNLRVCDNQLKSVYEGIIIEADADLLNTRVQGNTVTTASAGGGYSILLEGTASASFYGLVIDSNIIYDCGYGIRIRPDLNLYHAEVTNNVINETSSHGIRIDPDTGDTFNLRCCGNILNNVDNNGIFIDFPNNARSVLICDNTIRYFGKDLANGNSGIRVNKQDAGAGNAIFYELTVSGNTVFYDEGGATKIAYGIFLLSGQDQFTAALPGNRRWNITNNTVQLGGTLHADARAFFVRVDLLSGRKALRNVMFMGNMFMGAGIEYDNLTSSPPDAASLESCVAIGNISDDASFNWTDIISYFDVNSKSANNIDQG